HRDERPAIGFVRVVDDGDVRVLDGRGGLRFLEKAAAALRIVNQVLRQDLERDLAVEPRVGRAIDDAHATAADFARDAIVREGLADKIHAGRSVRSVAPKSWPRRAWSTRRVGCTPLSRLLTNSRPSLGRV